jgi:hypothetical protein
MHLGFSILVSRTPDYAVVLEETQSKEKENPGSGHDMSCQKANQNHLNNAIPQNKPILQGDQRVNDNLKEKTQKPVSEKNSDQGEDLERYPVGNLKEKNPQSPDVKKQVSREGFSGQRQNDENNNANCGANTMHPKKKNKK